MLSPVPSLQINLFGQFQIQFANQKVTSLEVRKAQELLSFLLLYRERRHNRENLATLLWSDKTAAQAKKYLRQTLWQIQSALNERTALLDSPQEATTNPNSSTVTLDPMTSVILAEGEWVYLNPQVEYQSDFGALEDAYKRVQNIPGHALAVEQIDQLTKIVAQYRGDLLEDCYQDWCIFERERFQTMYLLLMEKLLAYSESQQEYDSGIIYGAQILRYDCAHERTHRRLMRLHYQSGNRSAALRQYRACQVALIEELGVEPSQRTQALYIQICTDSPTSDLTGEITGGSNTSLQENSANPLETRSIDPPSHRAYGENVPPSLISLDSMSTAEIPGKLDKELAAAVSYLHQLQESVTLLQQRIEHCLSAANQAV